ncbi:EH signature domain-containing protein [Marinobacter nauticus]|uniref:Zorya protein ZorC EH domain-containing protein n=1 Tax=Marinobacter nauticus TaxID=2743 RepID=A0A1M2UXB5_MARNT|nr:EH signature domain-containing protein [Marinobacter nauticus]OJS99966.1 hypothetical protein BEE62_07585 [Marinobacter nauticus]
MKLPTMPGFQSEWAQEVTAGWAGLIEKTKLHAQSAGGGDAFDQMCERIRRSVRHADYTDIYDALETRLGARALTWLWVHEREVFRGSCRVSVVNALVQKQQPRLTRLTFLQLLQLYFEEFDRLNAVDDHLFDVIGEIVRSQALKIPEHKNESVSGDPIATIKANPAWVISDAGPANLAERVRESGFELEKQFSAMGMIGYDSGRYGDLCRAHYYIEALKAVPVGHWDEVFDELMKPSVSLAPYGEGKRIGHAALEVIIDRAGAEVSESWQQFVLGIAGDPRIQSGSRMYQEWWKPLGEERIEKVRAWLSKEDLKLFLQALEQYGIESGKADLKRMFPSRKRFLEGLYNQKRVRSTRLMLGNKAQDIVKRLLGDEIKTNFARLEGTLSDKAIIFLDCGDFFLVEGSHSFKIWVYLAKPGTMVWSYEFPSFSHNDLTRTTPDQYEAMYGLPYESVTHNGPWQSKVINFLAEHGIDLDIEALLTWQEYRGHLNRYGMPVIKTPKTVVPPPRKLPGYLEVRAPKMVERKQPPRFEDLFKEKKPLSAAERFLRGRPEAKSEKADAALPNIPRPHGKSESKTLSEIERTVLGYMVHNPGVKARHVAALLSIPLKDLIIMFTGPLSPFVKREDLHTWVVKPESIHKFK